MENFIAYNPTKLYFGKDVHKSIPKEISDFGKKVLLITGKGSVKKYGYYDEIIKQLVSSGKEIIEFSGIKPNPTVEAAEQAVDLAKKENIDFIIAVGGGSVIDTAKLVNIAYANNSAVWEIMKGKVTPQKNVPLIAVLTLAATGSEMNGGAVLQNHQTKEKIGYHSGLMYPKVSFLDPSWTISVPKNQTVNGIVDLIAHNLESYFADGNSPLSDRFVAANILETIDYTPKLLKNLSDYDLRARMMWSATVAINGTAMHGRTTSGDWGPHALAHHISLLWDIPHGQTLSIIFPAWMKAMKFQIKNQLEQLGYLLTGKQISADETIQFIETFFKQIGAPVNLKELNLNEKNKQELLELWLINRPSGLNIKLNKDNYNTILKFI